jgi:polysaccharide biosynthesis protein PslF
MELSLVDRIHWTGYVAPAELAGWLETASLVALPYADGASLRRTSLITAWRRRRPVVTTVPALDVTWRQAEVAAFVPPQDSPALANAIRSLLSDPDRSARVAAAGAQFAQRFAWSAVVRETGAVYEAALRQRRV